MIRSQSAIALCSVLILAGCNVAAAGSSSAPPDIAEIAGPKTSGPKTATPKTMASPVPPAPVSIPEAAPAGPADFLYDGHLIQGGWIRGQVPAGTVSARLGDISLTIDGKGYFFAAFDRDTGPRITLSARLRNGNLIDRPLVIAPRAWKIERVNIARRSGGASEAFMARRRPELAQINAARNVGASSRGWAQDFIWPVTGRISGRFGSQRIYRGVPGSYHSGIDIATGKSGTPFVAPADGVVTLATAKPFSLEGYLLIIDHGQGLNSAFLHMSRISVKKGDSVKQGQYIGNIGSSGRATGPHLHWSLKWRTARLDPLLFTGPMK